MKMKSMLHVITGICIGLWICFPADIPATDGRKDRRIEQPVEESIDIRQATQKKEEQWRREKERRMVRLDTLQRKNADLQSRKSQLVKQVKAARDRVSTREKQWIDIQQISDQIPPFLESLIKTLESRLSEGLPFLLAERRNRISGLKTLTASSDVSVDEKYRKAMEALMIEAEYGFSVDAYPETIAIEGKKVLTEIIRLGRLCLFYLSLDRKRCGFYNVASGLWQPLPAIYTREIQAVLEIGTRRRAAKILTLPLGRIVAP